MRARGWMTGLALAVVMQAGAPAMAQDAAATEIIKNRIANFREIGTAYKGIGDELKVANPYMGTIQESARQIESLGSEILHWFPEGSGPQPEPEMGIIDTILSWFSSDAT